MIDVKELFEKHDGEYIKFDRIRNPPSSCPDLCAMLYMSHFLTMRQKEKNFNMLSHTSHDVVFFCVDVDYFSEVATEEDVIYLLRCGVGYDSSGEGLFMFM